jgi:hypothetical protein
MMNDHDGRITTGIDYEARRVMLVQPVLASFLNLAEPRRVSKSTKEEPKYSINLEFDPDSPDLKAIRAKIMEQALWFARSGEDGAAEFRAVAGSSTESIAAAIRSGALKTSIEDGDKLADKAQAKGKKREWSRGKKVLAARSQKPVACAIIANGQINQLDDASQIKLHAAKYFYTGVLVVGELDIKAYGPVGVDGKPGITAYLASVVSFGKGDKLAGGGPNLAEKFRGHVGLSSDEDPTGEGGDTDW